MTRFADTNILLYSISTDPAEQEKAAIADELLQADDIVISTQVLGEFYVQATRSSRAAPLAHDDATALIRDFAIHPVQSVTVAVVEAALAAGCHEVLSEDKGDRQEYGGIRVVNPFRGR